MLFLSAALNEAIYPCAFCPLELPCPQAWLLHGPPEAALALQQAACGQAWPPGRPRVGRHGSVRPCVGQEALHGQAQPSSVFSALPTEHAGVLMF